MADQEEKIDVPYWDGHARDYKIIDPDYAPPKNEYGISWYKFTHFISGLDPKHARSVFNGYSKRFWVQEAIKDKKIVGISREEGLAILKQEAEDDGDHHYLSAIDPPTITCPHCGKPVEYSSGAIG